MERRPSPESSTPSGSLGSNEPGGDPAPVPRLPRGSGLRLSGQAIIRIVMFAALLAGVIMLREPCASSVATFMGQFEGDAGIGDGSPGQAERAGDQADQADQADPLPPGNYVRITGDMSEQELEQALRQAGVAFEDAGGVDAGVPDATPGATRR